MAIYVERPVVQHQWVYWKVYKYLQQTLVSMPSKSDRDIFDMIYHFVVLIVPIIMIIMMTLLAGILMGLTMILVTLSKMTIKIIKAKLAVLA